MWDTFFACLLPVEFSAALHNNSIVLDFRAQYDTILRKAFLIESSVDSKHRTSTYFEYFSMYAWSHV